MDKEQNEEEIHEEIVYDANALDNIDLSVANQKFLQENFREMSMDELCEATKLPPDVVAAYLDAFEQAARDSGIDPTKHFALTITLNENGNFGFGIQFPREEKLEESIEAIGRLLFALNEGNLKQSLVTFLHHFAEQRQADVLVGRIIKVWNDLLVEKLGRNRPLVRADEVLAK